MPKYFDSYYSRESGNPFFANSLVNKAISSLSNIFSCNIEFDFSTNKIFKFTSIIVFFFSVLFLFTKCVTSPEAPEDQELIIGDEGVFILCEGLWGSDNSTIDRIDLASGRINNSYFRLANPNMKLGDNAGDVVIKGDSVFVAIATYGTIEIFSKSTGKSFGRITLPNNSQPRKMSLINDTTLLVSLLFKQAIAVINPVTLNLLSTIDVGPFPEGIASFANKLFVANSGYGDYFHKQPKAGTISVIDIIEKKEIANLTCGNNPIEVVASSKFGRVYAAYYNLPSLKDSLGGIIEYDASNFTELRHWRLRATDITLSASQDTLFFLNGNTEGISGINFIDLNENSAVSKEYIANPNPSQIWYALEQSPDKSSLWIGNAKRFESNGEILIFENRIGGNMIRNFATGINPNKIIFFK